MSDSEKEDIPEMGELIEKLKSQESNETIEKRKKQPKLKKDGTVDKRSLGSSKSNFAKGREKKKEKAINEKGIAEYEVSESDSDSESESDSSSSEELIIKKKSKGKGRDDLRDEIDRLKLAYQKLKRRQKGGKQQKIIQVLPAQAPTQIVAPHNPPAPVDSAKDLIRGKVLNF